MTEGSGVTLAVVMTPCNRSEFGGFCFHTSRATDGGFTAGMAYRGSTKPAASASLAFNPPLSHRSRALVKGKVVPHWRGKARRHRLVAPQARKQEWNQPIAKHRQHAAVRSRRRQPACQAGERRGLVTVWCNSLPSGSNSVVECQLPKLDVAGSSPVSRSMF